MSQHRIEIKRSRLRRLFPALIGAIAMVVGGVVAIGVSAASAHTPRIDLECTGWSVNLQSYAARSGGNTNTIVLTVDGVTIDDGTFGTSYTKSGSFAGSTADSHSMQVTVVAWDNPQYNVNYDQTVSGCAPATPPDVPKDCTFVWEMTPGATSDNPFPAGEGPQKLVGYDCDSGNPPSYTKKCGVMYQIDRYRVTVEDRARLQAMLDNLINSGVLNGSSEDSALGDAWTKAHNNKQYWSFENGPACDSDVPLTPPTINEVTCSPQDAGHTVWSTVTVTDTDKIHYAQEPGTAEHTVKVTATAVGNALLTQTGTDWTIASDKKSATTVVTLTSKDCGSGTELVPPTLGEAQCTAADAGGTVWGSVSVTDSDKIHYSVSTPDAVTHQVTVTATVKTGNDDVFLTQSGTDWTIGADKKSATITVTPTSKACATTALVSPTLGEAQCTAADAGTTVYGTVSLTDTDKIHYSQEPGTAEHTVKVTATAVGDVFLTQTGTDWTIGSDKKSATIVVTLTAKDCVTTALVSPTLGQVQCTAADAGTTVWGSVTATDSDKIHYSVSTPDAVTHQVTVTATAVGDVFLTQSAGDGWDIAKDKKSATITVTPTAKDCVTTGLVSPTLGQVQCTAVDAGTTVWGSVSATDSDKIHYSVSAPDAVTHQVTVTATVKAGNDDVFLAQTGTDWTIDADKKSATITVTPTAKDCVTTGLASPTLGQVQCTAADAGTTVWGSVTATDSDKIHYSVSAPDAVTHQVTVTATVKAGNDDVFLAQTGTDWTIDADKKSATITVTPTSVSCGQPVPVDPTLEGAQCTTSTAGQTVYGTVTAVDKDGVTYVVSAPDAAHKVTVTATVSGNDFFGSDGDQVGTGAQKWTVSAGGQTATIEVSLPSKSCSTPPPPETPERLLARPSTNNQCLLVGDARTVTVTTTTVNGIDYTVTGNGTTTVTVTAKARSGYDLTVPTGWTDNHDGTATIVLTPNSDGVVCVGGESSTVTTPPSKTAAVVLPSNTQSVEVLPASETISGDIAYTGVDTLKYAALALLLLLGGGALLVFAKMRRAPRAH